MTLPIPDPFHVNDRPEYVAILKGAREYLWDGRPRTRRSPKKSMYICVAIEHYVSATDDRSHLEPIKQEIASRLITRDTNGDECIVFCNSSFDGWLKNTHGILAMSTVVQEARFRWLDQLIVEFGGQPMKYEELILTCKG